MNRGIRRTCRSLLLLFLLHAALLAQKPEYSIRRIEGARIKTDLGGLNDSTQVVGQGSQNLPFLWKEGRVTLLPVAPGRTIGAAYRINNRGVAVGDAQIPGGSTEPYRWANGGYTNLASGLNNSGGTAHGVNNHGAVSGYMVLGEPTYEYGVFVYDGSVHFLGVNGTGWSINDSGYVVGNCTVSDVGYGFIYRSGGLTLLPGMTIAYDINNRNQVVGVAPGGRGALLWDNGNTTILPSGAPDKFGAPTTINDSGTVVGKVWWWSTSSSGADAARWKNGTVSYLKDLIRQNSKILLWCAVDINNKDEILCSGMDSVSGRWYYYLLTPGTPTVTRPQAGDVWISGEVDTIRWDFIARDTKLLLEFSTDDGQTFQAIAGDIPADSGKYAWEIPKDILSTKCIIRLRDSGTLDSMAMSERFRIKPFVLTKIDPSTGDYIAYTVPIDQWGFSNTSSDIWHYSWYVRFNYRGTDPFTGSQYSQSQGNHVFRNAALTDFPDWVSFVNAFTVDACYWNTTLGIYSRTALARWATTKKAWNGSCFGIAISNALAFERQVDFNNRYPRFPGFTLAQSVPSDTNVIPVVNELYTHQLGNPHLGYRSNVGLLKTPTETVNDLKRMFKEDLAVRTLSMLNNGPGGGGHAILAYEVDRTSNTTPVWDVHVYDNSYPNVPDAIIKVDTSQNGGKGTWAPQYAWNGWGGDEWFYLRDSAMGYLTNPTLPKVSSFNSPFVLEGGVLEVNNSVKASIDITDGHGNTTGFVNRRVVNDIPGSIPLVMENGSIGAPFGYMLTSGNYSVRLDSFTTGESRVTLFFGNRAFSYERSDAESSQTDVLHIDTTDATTLSLANPDPGMKSITLENILNEAAGEKVYTVSSLELSSNDSLVMRNADSDKLRLESHGSAKDYSIRVEHASPVALCVFERSAIALTANTTHTVVPNWGTLDEGPLTILVDRGNDGTVDDTLRLENQLTGADLHGSLIPAGYRLDQNYPNPFNPTTEIRYQVSGVSNVKLVVYDVLGSEVATLVDEVKEPGTYTVQFDGSNRASGVYLYRLQAGEYVQTRKLLLLR